MENESAQFRKLLERMTQAICRGDGAAAAACFIPDGVYHDGFYGEFRGRDGNPQHGGAAFPRQCDAISPGRCQMP